MRGRKPFKFNVTSKRRLVSRKHKDSASPSPSPKRNRSNSRIDKSHGKRSKKEDRDSRVDRSHKKSSEADRARDNNSERSDDRSCMDKSPRNSSEGNRVRGRSSEKTDRNISKSTDRVRGRSSEKTDRNSSIDESSERSSSLGSDESHGRSGGSSKRELSEIHSKVDYLIKEIHDIKKVQVEQAARLDNHTAVAVNRDESAFPEPNIRKQCRVLEAMSEEQYKLFRDEIVQILAGLDSSLSLDHTQPWNEIQSHVSKDIMPAIDKALKDRIVYNQTELKYVLQQLHCHRRESWQISQNVEKVKEDKKRKGTNSRRSDVRKLLRCADGVGESVQHIKIQRKRWYNDRIFKDDSKPPEDAPYWTISSTYKPDQANQEEDQEGSSNPQDPQVLDE
ncbi:hypothetical protein RhiirA4_421353 [Rhizophagus irregularis]|uniref:Uncharacterized protein n=1 Tax=Rhizophagus irregularis TaxID=588596 RepID=A0A2I1GLA2_9GLOM|nr:hypothetical protein RhiirA4_421353 [Rhizophagus irregularis]